MKALFAILALVFVLSGCPQEARLNIELDAMAFTVTNFECKSDELISIKNKVKALVGNRDPYTTESGKIYDIAADLNTKVATECQKAVLDACSISSDSSTAEKKRGRVTFTDQEGPIEDMGISLSQTTLRSKEEDEDYFNYSVRISKAPFLKAMDCLIKETKS